MQRRVSAAYCRPTVRPKPGSVIENGYPSGVVEDGGYASFDVDFLDELCEPCLECYCYCLELTKSYLQIVLSIRRDAAGGSNYFNISK